MMSLLAVALIFGGIFLFIADQNGAFIKLPPPSPEVAALIEEIKTGPNDWETTDYNGYYARYWSPSRMLLIHARPSMEPASDDHVIWMARIDELSPDHPWYSDRQYRMGTSPVPAPDGSIILKEVKPYLRKAKPVIKPSPVARVVAEKGKKRTPSEPDGEYYADEPVSPDCDECVPEAREIN